MSRRRSKSIRVSGIISIPEWGMETIADVALTTDFGKTYFLLDSEEIGDPYDWVDRYVEVTGHVAKRDGMSFIDPVEIREEVERQTDVDTSHYYDTDEEWGLADDDYDHETELY